MSRPRSSRLTATIHRAGPDLVALVLFTLLWLGIMVGYGAKLHLVEGSIILPMVLAGVFVVIGLFRGRAGRDSSPLRRTARILRDWLPLIYLVMVYETLRDYTGTIRPDYIDSTLYRMDVFLFGVEPTVWIGRFFHPLLVEYAALSYGLYIVPPMALAGLLYLRSRREEFREVALATVFCMFGGFILYIAFPAGPPRFYEGLNFDPPTLSGSFGFYEYTHRGMDLSKYVIHRASFPSLHVALTTLGIVETWRFGGAVWKRSWLTFAAAWIGVSVWFATIYLRHHWAVDVIAGWVLALASYYLASFVCSSWKEFAPKNV